MVVQGRSTQCVWLYRLFNAMDCLCNKLVPIINKVTAAIKGFLSLRQRCSLSGHRKPSKHKVVCPEDIPHEEKVTEWYEALTFLQINSNKSWFGQELWPTCVLEKMKTSAAPAAVRPQVKSVPNTACTTGLRSASMLLHLAQQNDEQKALYN